MSLNKAMLLCLLVFGAVASSAQQGASGAANITLEEYANILAAKLKQGELAGASSSTQVPAIKVIPLAAPPSGTQTGADETKPRKVVPADPLGGWVYNGATLEATTKQPLFGELVTNGVRRLVYNGDVLAQMWRVVVLTESAIEFQNVACEAPLIPAKASANHAKKASKSGNRVEQICTRRLTRRV